MLVDTPVLGFLVGVFIGLIGGQNVMDSVAIGAKMSAVLVLLPKIAGVLIEGLNPLSIAIRKFMQKRHGEGKELIIGMDVATGIGEPCGITVAVLIIPIIIIIALICPWIKSFPALLLGGTIYWSVIASMVNKKNVLRALVTVALFVTVATTFATLFASQCEAIILAAGLETGASGGITCIGLTDRVGSILALLIGSALF